MSDTTNSGLRAKVPASEQESALAAPAYSGIAQVFSHTLTASAAMLAFFFLFQGTLLANFPTLYEKFSNATFPELGNFPLGRVALVALCALALTFTVWSFLIVRIFKIYVDYFVASGDALETGNGKVNGLFAALSAAFTERAWHRLLTWTTWTFFAMLVLLWLGLMAIAVYGRPPPVLATGGFL